MDVTLTPTSASPVSMRPIRGAGEHRLPHVCGVEASHSRAYFR